jgi:hypothetical protein
MHLGLRRMLQHWWCNLPRREGYYRNTSEARVWDEISVPEGKVLFRNATMDDEKCVPDEELRIGIALAME